MPQISRFRTVVQALRIAIVHPRHRMFPIRTDSCRSCESPLEQARSQARACDKSSRSKAHARALASIATHLRSDRQARL